MTQKIIILDFGSQYTQFIARRLRELNVFCEIQPFNKSIEYSDGVKGVILSGSPCSVNDDDAPQINTEEIYSKVPLLGVCYGAQYLAKSHGGIVEKSEHREYGRAKMIQSGNHNALLDGLSYESQVWMSHGDSITKLPENTKIIATTDSIPVAAFELTTTDKPTYGIQFHPEVYHSTQGLELLKNFAKVKY